MVIENVKDKGGIAPAARAPALPRRQYASSCHITCPPRARQVRRGKDSPAQHDVKALLLLRA